jgi:hypothetical protein
MNVMYEKNNMYTFEFHTYFGITGKSYIDFIKNLNVDLKIYFNNSKSFDAHFILSELLDSGFNTTFELDVIDKIEDESTRKMYTALKEKRVSYLNEFYKANKRYRESDNENKAKFIRMH